MAMILVIHGRRHIHHALDQLRLLHLGHGLVTAQELRHAQTVARLQRRHARQGWRRHDNHLLANISSRLSSTLPTTVQAARSTASIPGGTGPRGWVAISSDSFGFRTYSSRAFWNRSTSRPSSLSLGGRVRHRRKPWRALLSRLAPPSLTMRRARAWAASANTGSLSVTNACKGVLVRGRLTVQTLRSGASNVAMLG